jgi:hypothetical protein
MAVRMTPGNVTIPYHITPCRGRGVHGVRVRGSAICANHPHSHFDLNRLRELKFSLRVVLSQ